MGNKKFNLPLIDRVFAPSERPPALKKKPSVEAARTRLGGRMPDGGSPPAGVGIGCIVSAAAPGGGARKPGVVVFATAQEAHVLLDGARLRRMTPAELLPHDGDVPALLVKLAADARVFSLLSEGQPVRYADDAGGFRAGKLVEKCRYGALVLRDDGAIVAVGFRKLWPVPQAGDA